MNSYNFLKLIITQLLTIKNFIISLFYIIYFNYLTYKNKYIKYSIIRTNTYGNFLTDLIYYKSLTNNFNKFKLILIRDEVVINSKLLDFAREYFIIKQDDKLLKILRKIHLEYFPEKIFIKNILKSNNLQNRQFRNFLIPKQLNFNKLNYFLNQNDKKKLNLLLERLNINFQKEIILICNRDNYYTKSYFGNKKKYDNTRNSSFVNLDKTIKYLLSKEYNVIRVGDYEDIENSNVISINSLSSSEKKFLNFAIHSISTLAISGSNGNIFSSTLFNNPILLINATYLDLYNIGFHKCVFLPKLYKRNNKILTISEIAKKNIILKNPFICLEINSEKKFLGKKIPLAFIESQYELSNLKIVLEENSDDEILNATKEAFESLNGLIKLSKKDQINQERFKEQFQINNFNYKDVLISPYFLNKYDKELFRDE